MTPKSQAHIHQRLLADPEIQAILSKNDFVPCASVSLIVDLNNAASDYRRIIAEHRCQTQAAGRWRRRVIQRMGSALLDRIDFEFEDADDADRLRLFLLEKGW